MICEKALAAARALYVSVFNNCWQLLAIWGRQSILN